MPSLEKWSARWQKVVSAWRYFVSHPLISVPASIVGVLWAWYQFDWATVSRIVGTAWAMLTPGNVAFGVAVLLWASCAVALGFGYYEQRIKVLERDKDCNVLSKLSNDLRRQLRLAEMERDDARAKVIELQQQQDSVPHQLQYLRGESQELSKSRAHLALENLALIAREKKWVVSIVIRFLDYPDHDMADDLKKFLQIYDQSWSIEPRYQSGDTLRPQLDGSRIEITSNKNTSEFAGRLTWALATGRYLTSRVHHVSGEESTNDVVVTIFPKAKSEPKNG